LSIYIVVNHGNPNEVEHHEQNAILTIVSAIL